jgi:hypothetical protein
MHKPGELQRLLTSKKQKVLHGAGLLDEKANKESKEKL